MKAPIYRLAVAMIILGAVVGILGLGMCIGAPNRPNATPPGLWVFAGGYGLAILGAVFNAVHARGYYTATRGK